MIGVTLDMSKPCCPMYNVCTSNKIDLIPPRLSNLPLPKISTKHVLKHRVISPRASLRSQLPAVGGAVLLGLGIVAHAISTTGAIEETTKFVVGDLIEVEKQLLHVEKIDLDVITLKKYPIGGSYFVNNTYFDDKPVINITRSESHGMEAKVKVVVDKAYKNEDKIAEIVDELLKMMEAQEDVYKKDPKLMPSCDSEMNGKGFTIFLRCNLEKNKDYGIIKKRWSTIEMKAADIIRGIEGVTIES